MLSDELIKRCQEEGARIAMLSPDEIIENYKDMLRDPEYKEASQTTKNLVRRFVAISLNYSRHAEKGACGNES